MTGNLSRRSFIAGAVGAPFVLSGRTTDFSPRTATVNGQMAHLFDIQQNQWHRTLGGRSYGAWADGPLNPYRVGADTYFQLPHSENYRIRIPQSQWGNRPSWQIDPNSSTSAYDSPRQPLESQYNFRHWIFGVWSSAGSLVGLTHHEWYPATTPDGMFRSSGWWITGIGHVTMSATTGNWSLTAANDSPTSKRLVLVPQPSSAAPTSPNLPEDSPFFGFAHPSNIVYSGGYYYVFTTAQSLVGGNLTRGVALIRTANVAASVGWQFWNGSSWTAVDHNTYQGNGSPGQSPYLFWTSWPYRGELAAFNVRQHASGSWIIVGRDQQESRPLLLSSTASLSNPIDLESSLQVVPVSFPTDAGMPVYYSLFDPTTTGAPGDLNYQQIGSTPLLVATMDDAASYYHQYLTLSGW